MSTFDMLLNLDKELMKVKI